VEQREAMVALADRAVADARATLLDAIRAEGLPERLAPRLTIERRDEGWVAGRRHALRQLAVARTEAAGREALTTLSRRESDLRVRIVAAGLRDETTARAAASWLDLIPSAEQLVPFLDLAELEAEVDTASDRQR
jgi:hypothetical protein